MKNINIESFLNIMIQIWSLLSKQNQAVQNTKAATALQMMALQYLRNQTGATVTSLSHYLKLSKSSGTQLVERLVKLGLVERNTDDKDRRITKLKITKIGLKELQIIRRKLIHKMQKFLSKIPVKDQLELLRIYSNLMDTLKKEQHA